MSKAKLDNLIRRVYTKALEDNKSLTVYDLFEWKTVDVRLLDFTTGKPKFEMKDVEFPSHYTQTACDIIASKYFRRAGVPNAHGTERSMREVVHRMVHFWTLAALDEGIIEEAQKQVLYDELAYIMLNQMMAPNSPQWFNTGLYHEYGIAKEAEGFYYYDPETGDVAESKLAYQRTAGSACFILKVDDALLGPKSITDTIATETRLFKYGAGTGSNFSRIRGRGEKLSGGGTSSGLMSFLKIYDVNAGAIKSGGTTRRAAKIVSLDADHPDVMDFIQWKSKEEEKVVALGKMGYDTSFEGEAYQTVSGQNSNNSLRITNAFMKKISGEDADPIWTLKGRVDSRADKPMQAKELWDAWNQAAWRCGDPAPQFHDLINEWNTCPNGEGVPEEIEASNPCSEYHFLGDTACNLLSYNVARFYDPDTDQFDIEGYLHAVALGQIVLEATIHWGHYPTKDVARRSYLFRTTGGGLANTGYLHMIMGHPYDSEEARNIAAALTGLLTGQSYLVSSLIAEKVGAFPMYETNREPMNRVIRNHARVAGARNDDYEGLSYRPLEINHELLEKENRKDLGHALKQVWEKTVQYGASYGFRNAQVTVIAPTGTISFAMDCATTSIEPFFSHVVYKKLSGGGHLEIVNPAIPLALRKLGYSEEETKDIEAYILRRDENGFIADGKIEGAPHLKEEHYAVFDTANQCGTGIRFISPEGHVRMVAQITPLISGAISKTVNLPNSATVQDFADIHMLGWKLGAKAIALYRDGCKASQPLNTSFNEKQEDQLENLTYAQLLSKVSELQTKLQSPPVRRKPNSIVHSRRHMASIDGIHLFVHVGFDGEGKIVEIFTTADKEGSLVAGILDSLSIMISNSLQYGISPKAIAKALKGHRYEPHGLVTGHPYIKSVDSLSDLIAKIIEIELGDFNSCHVKPKPGEFFTQKQLLAILRGSQRALEELQDESAESNSDQKHNLDHKYGHSHDHNHSNGHDQVKHSAAESMQKVYGKKCTACGSDNMRKNGTCYVCAECGETTGCS